MRRATTVCTILLVLVMARVGASPQQPAAQQQQQPAFRSSIIVVPIDVRVIDNKTGKAVGDLKAEDFTLLEDGAPQPIRLFVKHNYRFGLRAYRRSCALEPSREAQQRT